MTGEARSAVCERAREPQELYDLWIVLVHEYGHFVVAEHFGLLAWVHVNPRVDAAPNERHYAGQCGWSAIDQQPTSEQKQTIALAGVVAEYIDAAGGTDVFPSDMFDSIGHELVLSASDAALAGEFDVDDVERTYELLLELRHRHQELVDLAFPERDP
jgi:hypothetical protein